MISWHKSIYTIYINYKNILYSLHQLSLGQDLPRPTTNLQAQPTNKTKQQKLKYAKNNVFNFIKTKVLTYLQEMQFLPKFRNSFLLVTCKKAVRNLMVCMTTSRQIQNF